MRLELTGRHLDITPVLRRLVSAKLAKLERLLNDRALSAQVVLVREKHRHCCEITLHAKGEKFLHAVSDAGSWEASLAAAGDKLVQQALKMKGKWQERKRRSSKPVEEVPAAESAPAAKTARVRPRMPRVLKIARQTIQEMSLADAAREVDTNGEGVVVFRAADTGSLSVLYRRPGGELALVEADT